MLQVLTTLVLDVSLERKIRRKKRKCFFKNKSELTDIEKIVGMYQRRGIEDKFSHRAPLAEVAENDYNLNIPRYVDTFEEEEAIDLGAVTAELRAIDANMGDLDKQIAAFCDQLGIEAPV